MMNENCQPPFSQTKAFCIIVLVPLFIFTVALFFYSDTLSRKEIIQQRQVTYQKIQTLKIINSQNHGMTEIKNKYGQILNIDEERTRLHKELRKLNSAYQYSRPLLNIVLILSGISCLSGLFGVKWVNSIGKKARSSESSLIESFKNGKKLLPSLLFTYAISFVLSTGLLACITCLIFFSNGLFITVMFFSLVALISICIRLHQANFGELEEEENYCLGNVVIEKDAPKLFSLIRGLTQKYNLAMPQNVILGYEPNFYITQYPVHLWKQEAKVTGRTLYLSLSYMHYLSLQEFLAILGHELAHFTGSYEKRNMEFLPSYQVMIRNFEALYSLETHSSFLHVLFNDWASFFVKPVTNLAYYFLDEFARANAYVSRKREIVADKMSAAVTSTENVYSALIRTIVIDPAIAKTLDDFWSSSTQDKDIQNIFLQLDKNLKHQKIDDIKAHLVSEKATPYDCHPTTIQRMRALQFEPDNAFFEKFTNIRPSLLLETLNLKSRTDEAEASIVKNIELQLTEAVYSEKKEKIQELNELIKEKAGKIGSTVVITERGGTMVIILIITILLWSLTAALVWEVGSNVTLFDLLLFWFIPIIIMGKIAYNASRRNNTEVISFGKEGVKLPNFRPIIPWDKLEEFFVEENRLGLRFEENFPLLPQQSCPVRVEYDSEYNSVIFKVNGYNNKLTPTIIFDKLIDYSEYYQAKALLGQLLR